jgi:hypothetical protein
MKNLIQAAVVTLFAASTAQAQQAVQWRVEDGGNGHWYQLLVNQQTTFWEAASAATQRGGHLVTVSTDAENAFVRQISLGHFVHFGAYQDPAVSGWAEPAAGWTWITGEPWRWSGWCPGQPDNANWNQFSGQELARFASADGSCWDDAHSMQQIATWAIGDTMIEWSADCNGDGIVDYGQCRAGTLPDYNGNNIPDCCERGEACVVGNYPVQWRVEDGGNGHWYRMVVTPAPTLWVNAKSLAESLGGHLASIRSDGENGHCLGVCAGGPKLPGGSVWLGAVQPNGEASSFAWVTGEPFDWTPGCGFSNTDAGCGFEDRLTMTSPWNGCPWNDVAACWLIPALLVEWDADCNNDGIVDYGQILQGQLADTNSDGIPDICQQPTCVAADLFRDFNVNGADLGILLSQWGPNSPLTVSDINSDGVVNGADLGILLSFWGPCPN